MTISLQQQEAGEARGDVNLYRLPSARSAAGARLRALSPGAPGAFAIDFRFDDT